MRDLFETWREKSGVNWLLLFLALSLADRCVHAGEQPWVLHETDVDTSNIEQRSRCRAPVSMNRFLGAAAGTLAGGALALLGTSFCSDILGANDTGNNVLTAALLAGGAAGAAAAVCVGPTGFPAAWQDFLDALSGSLLFSFAVFSTVIQAETRRDVCYASRGWCLPEDEISIAPTLGALVFANAFGATLGRSLSVTACGSSQKERRFYAIFGRVRAFPRKDAISQLAGRGETSFVVGFGRRMPIGRRVFFWEELRYRSLHWRLQNVRLKSWIGDPLYEGDVAIGFGFVELPILVGRSLSLGRGLSLSSSVGPYFALGIHDRSELTAKSWPQSGSTGEGAPCDCLTLDEPSSFAGRFSHSGLELHAGIWGDRGFAEVRAGWSLGRVGLHYLSLGCSKRYWTLDFVVGLRF